MGCGIKSMQLIFKTEMFICQSKANLDVSLLVKSIIIYGPKTKESTGRGFV